MLIIIFFINIIVIIFFRKYLSRKKIFDQPAINKTHSIPITKGSGISIFISITSFTLYNIIINNNQLSNFGIIFIDQFLWVFLISFFLMGIITLYDDYFYIHHIWRLLAQVLVVFILINSIYTFYFSYINDYFFFNLPKKIWLTLFFFFWLFFINSTNFIDGVDGNFSFYGICTSFFYSIIFYIINLKFFYELNLLIFITFLVMIYFNFSKKYKMFSGDVGTILYGLLLGFNFTIVSLNGFLFFAILLHSYVIIDICFTLFNKLIKKENIFYRHRDFLFFKIYERNYFFNFIINFICLCFSFLFFLKI